MPIAFGDCEQITQQPILVLEESRSKMIFSNSARKGLRKVKVDGCLQIKGIKCDYLVISETAVEHFVELKGADVRHATAQLEATIQITSSNPKNGKKHCFIVSTRCPLLTPEIQNLKARFKKLFNSSLTIKNIVCEFEIV